MMLIGRMRKWLALGVLMAALGPAAAVALAATAHDGGVGLGPTTTTGTTSTTITVTTPTTVPTPTTGTQTTTTVTTTTRAPAPAVLSVPKLNPFARPAMWIWELPRTDQGSVGALIAQAKLYDIGTIFVKSSDGTTWWPQFSSAVVRELHAAHIDVCAWQYVYGASPSAEAALGAKAVRSGADCLVIDAESQYQGKYVQAQTYMADLRRQIGKSFPVALAGFPYVDYHPSFPYSVFLAKGAAQYNVPQMYWKDIGVSVPTVYSHTYEYNEIYQRPIFPLGQMFDGTTAAQVKQFNVLGKDYGATGESWWVWQDASLPELGALSTLGAEPANFVPTRSAATIDKGENGDLTVWAQERLAPWGAKHLTGSLKTLLITGKFNAQTKTIVEDFQKAHGLKVTGKVDGFTWDQLLKLAPVKVRWVKKKAGTTAVISSAENAARAAATGGTVTAAAPAQASLGAGHNELHGDPGQGRE